MSFFISESTAPKTRQTVGDLRQSFKGLPGDMPVQWATDGVIKVSNIAGTLETLAAVPDETVFAYDVEYSDSGWWFDIYGHVSRVDMEKLDDS